MPDQLVMVYPGSTTLQREGVEAILERLSAAMQCTLYQESKRMLVKLSTDKTVSEVAVALQAAVQANHFGVMQVYNLKETLTQQDVGSARECLIFEACQPQQAQKVLEENMSVSAALPCRISIYEEGGKTILATLEPTTLLAMFNTPQLAEVVQGADFRWGGLA